MAESARLSAEAVANAAPEARPFAPEITGSVKTRSEPIDASPRLTQEGFEEVRPDYAIVVKLTGDNVEDTANTEKLTRALIGAGLYVQVRQGNPGTLLVLTKCSTRTLQQCWSKSLTNDWLFEISTPGLEEIADEDKEDEKASPAKQTAIPVSEADRLRVIFDLITSTTEEGGIGILVQSAEWSFIESVFPIHNTALNAKWLKRISTQWVINDAELDFIHRHFGDKIALYFGFLQFYFLYSLVPTILGIASQLLIGSYSAIYAALNCLWGLVFVQMWKRRQEQLAIRWGSKGASAIEIPRPEFVPERETADAVTGDIRPYYPGWKRVIKQFAFIPYAVSFVALLMSFQTVVFAIEIFITQVYSGPFKQYLSFLPTILLAGITPQLNAVYMWLVRKLNQFENHETEESYDISFTQKQFVFNFFVSYMGLFLTAYVYLPFGHMVVPHLDFIRTRLATVSGREIHITEDFQLNGQRLHQQVVYFAITAQIVAFALETIVPYVQRKVFSQARRMTSGELIYNDPENEREFLAEVRLQAASPVYEVQEDYRQMVVQFGHTMLFSSVWSYSPLTASINLWFQIRGDAAKICLESRRPVPRRTETIGPWLGTLSVLTWLSSLTCASIIAMFGFAHSNVSTSSEFSSDEEKLTHLKSLVSITPWSLLLVVLLSEHVYFIVSMLVSAVCRSLPTTEALSAAKYRYTIRKQTLEKQNIAASAEADVAVPAPAENEWKAISAAAVAQQTQQALVTPKTLKDKKNE